MKGNEDSYINDGIVGPVYFVLRVLYYKAYLIVTLKHSLFAFPLFSFIFNLAIELNMKI